MKKTKQTNKLDVLEFSELKNPFEKAVESQNCKQVNETRKQYSMETSFSGFVFTPLRYLS